MAVVLIDIVVLVLRLSYYSSLPSTGFSWYIYVKYMYSINLSNLVCKTNIDICATYVYYVFLII